MLDPAKKVQLEVTHFHRFIALKLSMLGTRFVLDTGRRSHGAFQLTI